MPYYERNLPHWLPEGKNLFVTWRLYGSLPAVIVATLRKTDDLKDGKRFRFIDRELDGAAFGPGLVARSENGEDRCCRHGRRCSRRTVSAPCFRGDAKPRASTVGTKGGLEAHYARKGRTARACNLALKRTGERFWQEESCDHWIRNSSWFEKIRTYIERKPVSAGSANTPKEWQWSGAFR